MKCIKYECKYYFNSDDYFEICHVANDYCVSGECIGFDKIDDAIEEIFCTISKLTREYNDLANLKDWIKENQEGINE